MPDFVNDLPLHPLVVHFVVVLLVIAVAGSVLVSVWPAVRRRYGWLVVATSGIGTALVPVATDSGEFLESRIGTNPGIQAHAALGDLLVWWALGLFVAVTALMIVHYRTDKADKAAREPEDTSGGGTAVKTDTRQATRTTVAIVVAAVATVGLAVGTGVHLYRVGDAGARLVWEFVKDTPPNGG